MVRNMVPMYGRGDRQLVVCDHVGGVVYFSFKKTVSTLVLTGGSIGTLQSTAKNS